MDKKPIPISPKGSPLPKITFGIGRMKNSKMPTIKIAKQIKEK
jgi:hypothetical protein